MADIRTIISLGGISLNAGAVKVERTNKGKSLTTPQQDYTVIDLETTGLDPQYDDIIEVAAIRCRAGMIVDTFSCLVNPCAPLSEFITELTGITNEMLATAQSIEKVLPEYLAFIGDDTVIAHNANFDVNFLYDNSAELHLSVFSNDFIDTMRMSRNLFSQYKHHRLSDLVSRFGIDCSEAHRALGDCRITLECYRRLLQHMDENGIKDFAPSYMDYKASSVTATASEFDPTHPLYGKSCVFTGALQKMKRKDAMQLVVNVGGKCEDRVTKETNYLILGNNDYCTSIKDGKSNKQKKAEKYKLAGEDIETITEDVFYELLGV